MNQLTIEPCVAEVTKSGQLYELFPTNNQNRRGSPGLNHCFLAQVVPCVARLRLRHSTLINRSGAKY
jgi:hypothetical protein